MVVPPTAIYGAVGLSYALSKDVGKLLLDIYHYNSDIKELRLVFDDYQQRLGIMITSFDEIQEYVEENFKQLVETASQHLNEKLRKAQEKLLKYKRIQWPFVKKATTEAIEALATWVLNFEGRYALLPDNLKSKFQEKTVNEKYNVERGDPMAALHAHIKMRAAKLNSDKQDPAQLLRTAIDEPPREKTQDIRIFRHEKDFIKIRDHVRENTSQLEKFRLEVAKLAAVLKAADPKLTYLPKTVGWFECHYPGENTPYSFGLAYEIRQDVVVQLSLKEVINKGPPEHSLSDRMKLALNFVSAMAYIRGLEWVHKAIRSSNVLLCYGRNDGQAPQKLGYVNLVGFNVARRGTGDVISTSMDNERDWKDQIYSHPDRQRMSTMAEDIELAHSSGRSEGLLNPPNGGNNRDPNDGETSNLASAKPILVTEATYYKYLHDVYSIGVVLLEIGLWEDLTIIKPDLKVALPRDRKRILIELSEKMLPLRVGKKYASLVKSCLDVDDEGPEVSDILLKLAEIHL